MWPPGSTLALEVRPPLVLLLGGVGFFANIEEEEKGAVKAVTGAILWEIDVAAEGRKRHLKVLGTDIVTVGAASELGL